MHFPAEQFPVEAVREVARLLESADLSEISIENGNAQSRLTLRRSVAVAALVSDVEADELEAEESDVLATAGDAPTDAAPTTTTVSAPCVGVFRSPKGGLEAGQVVKNKQLLGVVESLKIPNEIYAPQAGKITAVHAQDGQGVEWGQALVEIEPEAA